MADQRAPQSDADHPFFARAWAFGIQHLEPSVIARHRAALAEGLTGTVLEIGCGSGTMFPYYGPGIERVFAIEPEPYLHASAQEAARAVAAPIEVLAAGAEALPLPDASVDTVICSLVLCTVPDAAAALREIARVLVPGGELRYYEHVVDPPGSLTSRLQGWLDASGVWPRLAGGCHCARDTGAAIRAAGFSVERERASTFGPPLVLPVRRHLAGVARLPG